MAGLMHRVLQGESYGAAGERGNFLLTCHVNQLQVPGGAGRAGNPPALTGSRRKTNRGLLRAGAFARKIASATGDSCGAAGERGNFLLTCHVNQLQVPGGAGGDWKTASADRQPPETNRGLLRADAFAREFARPPAQNIWAGQCVCVFFFTGVPTPENNTPGSNKTSTMPGCRL